MIQLRDCRDGCPACGTGGAGDTNAKSSGCVSGTVSSALARIPLTTFDAVGDGTADTRGLIDPGGPLVAEGMPGLVYVGAEYCAFCAGER